MLDKPTASTAIGLELEGNFLKGIQLIYTKGKPRFDKLFEIPLDLTNVNPLYNQEKAQDFQKILEKSLVITALNTPEALIRQLDIKLKKDKDIEEVLLFQAEPLLPYPSDNAVIDYIKIGATDEGTLLTILAARKDHLQQHLEQWSKLNTQPEIVTTVPAALANFAALCSPSDHPYCIVHVGLDQSTCVLVQEGKLMAAQSIPQGIGHLKEALLKDTETTPDFGDIDISQLSAENHPALHSAWEVLRLEIKRGIFSFSKQVKGQTIQELLVTGPGALVPHLASTLAQDLEKQQIFPRQELFSSLTMGQIQQLAVPIGAALTGLPSAKNPINFRQGDLAYPHPWKRLINSIALYAGLCLVLAGAFYLLGQSYLAYRQDQIRQSFVELLEVMNKPYTSFEEEFEKKNLNLKSSTGEPLGLMQLNDKDLSERVESLDKELQATPDLFPLWPNIPKVSDVLAWLSTQHVLMSKKGKLDMKNLQSIQIESFNYSIVKRPDQNKKQDKYQVKVELEFTSPTPKLAREFHDSLIEPNALIDPKGEVKWNSSHGRYRTSFYLKDKTVYPSTS